MAENMLTTNQVIEKLGISHDEFRSLTLLMNIKGRRWVCRDKSVAWLFTKDQLILLLEKQLHMARVNQFKNKVIPEEKKSLLEERRARFQSERELIVGKE